MADSPCLAVLAAATCVAWLAALTRGQDLGFCSMEYGYRGGGTSTYEMAFVDGPFACCDRCADQYPKCQMWNHDSRTGACGLSTEFVIGALDDNFTVGDWVPPPPPLPPSIPAPALAPSADPQEDASPAPAPLPPAFTGALVYDYDLDVGAPCDFTDGVSFPGGYIKQGGTAAPSAQACCQQCEREPKCFSWTWQKDKKRCFMKNGIVSGRAKRGFVSGKVL